MYNSYILIRLLHGLKQTDALVQDSNAFSGSRYIPGTWGGGASCTVYGCYQCEWPECRIIPEVSFTVPVTAKESKLQVYVVDFK